MPASPNLYAVMQGTPQNALANLIGQTPAPPAPVQANTSNTSVSGPASFTHTFPGATKVGTLLIEVVAVSASAGAALGATPAGWTLVWTQAQGTLVVGVYAYYQNPGALTSFVLASPTATAGGIAGAFYEFANCPFTSDSAVNNQAATTAANSGGAGNAQMASVGSNNLVIGAVAWVLGAATMTLNNLAPAAGWVSATQVNSTNGVTNNAALQAAYYLQPSTLTSTSAGFRYGGTLSAGSVWDAGVSGFRSTASDTPVAIGTGILGGGAGDVLCSTGPAVVGNG